MNKNCTLKTSLEHVSILKKNLHARQINGKNDSLLYTEDLRLLNLLESRLTVLYKNSFEEHINDLKSSYNVGKGGYGIEPWEEIHRLMKH